MPLQTVPHAENRTSHVRWILVVVMCVISFISYILRTNISIVGDRVMHDLGLTQVQLGLILSAFAWGYAIFEFPGGIMGDVIGSRKSLAFAAIAWSILTALTAMIPGRSVASVTTILMLFIVIRFLVGAAQAPLFPVIGGAVGNGLPVVSWA